MVLLRFLETSDCLSGVHLAVGYVPSVRRALLPLSSLLLLPATRRAVRRTRASEKIVLLQPTTTMTMRLPVFSSLILCIISLQLLAVCEAFFVPPISSSSQAALTSSLSSSSRRSTVAPSSAETNTLTTSASSSTSIPPTWESKQHLYGVDVIQNNEMEVLSNSMSVTLDGNGAEVVAAAAASGESLPLPQTYITCGKCNSLFAIAEEDLGRGKGW